MLFFSLILRSFWAHFPAYLLGPAGLGERFRCSVVAFFEGPTSPLQRPSPWHPGAAKGVRESLWKEGFGEHFWCFLGVVKVAVSLQSEADLTPHEAPQGAPGECSKPR